MVGSGAPFLALVGALLRPAAHRGVPPTLALELKWPTRELVGDAGRRLEPATLEAELTLRVIEEPERVGVPVWRVGRGAWECVA